MEKWKKVITILEIVAAVTIVAEFVIEIVIQKSRPPKNGF